MYPSRKNSGWEGIGGYRGLRHDRAWKISILGISVVKRGRVRGGGESGGGGTEA